MWIWKPNWLQTVFLCKLSIFLQLELNKENSMINQIQKYKANRTVQNGLQDSTRVTSYYYQQEKAHKIQVVGAAVLEVRHTHHQVVH